MQDNSNSPDNLLGKDPAERMSTLLAARQAPFWTWLTSLLKERQVGLRPGVPDDLYSLINRERAFGAIDELDRVLDLVDENLARFEREVEEDEQEKE